jgi:hypothetical protein
MVLLGVIVEVEPVNEKEVGKEGAHTELAVAELPVAVAGIAVVNRQMEVRDKHQKMMIGHCGNYKACSVMPDPEMREMHLQGRSGRVVGGRLGQNNTVLL